jgi:hypothetical protein
MDKRELNNIPVLEDGQVYIYVLLNSAGNIKIGKTTNMAQRIQSLSASNGAGESIVNYYCSPATWLSNIEKIAHEHFKYARMSGEWFNGKKLTYNSVVDYVSGLFVGRDYERCNQLREQIIKEKQNK